MQLIKLVFESLCRALIRFFDNRFVASNDVEWYRMELDKAHMETQNLVKLLTQPVAKTAEIVDDEQQLMPVGKSKFKSWEQKRRELENRSRIKAMQLADEARVALGRKQTTAELESELLDGTD